MTINNQCLNEFKILYNIYFHIDSFLAKEDGLNQTKEKLNTLFCHGIEL